MSLYEGFSVTHRRYVPHSHARRGGGLVDPAFPLSLFGEVAAELLIRSDGDEGLFDGYTSVELPAPVQAGDVVEADATLVRIGNRAREVEFEARVVCRAAPLRGPTAADVLEPPLVVARARGTLVVPTPAD
ncbi:acyl-CoA hydrolase [Actinosynnema pretiosum subsp. pretiosum]|uniref:Acyl-CoA hydrolase n=2 Tax=Actinosynnema pretiosum TaxID=42197 RepID=A0A290Z6Z6_9PSEU|nr:acyl-CoA hydrolase [Actinosynnema pretiosum]ATE54807.1 acyl-CoA hydrolase [Actinosynnema pretiosum]AXX30769.1 3-aminobutyryl-CoA ammonia-lyase [Actinosynnema pretiosum subsp. pretiosum]QUF05116.1 acyl-CoA hydrolase [Actinosynnema pretiosum subsp. pretiosum]